MREKNIHLRTPNSIEFLKVAEFSFDNFVRETAKSTGQNFDVLKDRLGSAPNKIRQNDVWYLIEEDDMQIGFLWIQLKPESKAAFGYDIYLEPQFRSQGIGRKVMIESGKKLNDLGIESVEICVFEHNQIARHLYASLGFKKKNFDEVRRQFTLALDLRELEN